MNPASSHSRNRILRTRGNMGSFPRLGLESRDNHLHMLGWVYGSGQGREPALQLVCLCFRMGLTERVHVGQSRVGQQLPLFGTSDPEMCYYESDALSKDGILSRFHIRQRSLAQLLDGPSWLSDRQVGADKVSEEVMTEVSRHLTLSNGLLALIMNPSRPWKN